MKTCGLIQIQLPKFLNSERNSRFKVAHGSSDVHQHQHGHRPLNIPVDLQGSEGVEDDQHRHFASVRTLLHNTAVPHRKP